MRKQNKPLNIYLPLFIAAVSLVAFSYIYSQQDTTTDDKVKERNYISEVHLGISPNLQTRQPTANDIDTQLNFKTSNGNVYRLYESRDFVSYGRTFVVRVG